MKNLQLEFRELKEKHEEKLKQDNSCRGGDKDEESKMSRSMRSAILGQEKDEFEYATSWKRAFSHIYTKLTWMNSYALTNSLAA